MTCPSHSELRQKLGMRHRPPHLQLSSDSTGPCRLCLLGSRQPTGRCCSWMQLAVPGGSLWVQALCVVTRIGCWLTRRFLSCFPGSYECGICGKKYKYYNCFQTHVRAHRGEWRVPGAQQRGHTSPCLSVCLPASLTGDTRGPQSSSSPVSFLFLR